MTSWKQHAIAHFNTLARPVGFEISRLFPDAPGTYVENPEVGSVNFSEKLARLERGEDFEWPNIVALNRALVQFVAPAERVVNIGAGTGAFEWLASEGSTAEFVASEFDRDCVAWCRENRARPNIHYGSKTMVELANEPQGFDLAVSVDVVEHLADYASFLRDFATLAPRAIITTPNKTRNSFNHFAMPPAYEQHVREWTAGEFYWVARLFYSKVRLMALVDPNTGDCREVGPDSAATPLIALCER